MSINRNRVADNFIDELFLVALGLILFRDATLLAVGFVAAILTNSVPFSDASPELFVVEKGGQFVALPLIRRSISGTAFCDCTSAYGYVGPITNCSVKHEQELFVKFREELLKYVNYLRKYGFSIRKASTSDDIAVFTEIYRDTMVRSDIDSLFEFKSGFSRSTAGYHRGLPKTLPPDRNIFRCIVADICV